MALTLNLYFSKTETFWKPAKLMITVMAITAIKTGCIFYLLMNVGFKT
jgi:hypothetical protein